MLQARRLWIQFLIRSTDFSIDLILPATQWPWDQLSFEKKWPPGIFLGVKGDWRIRLLPQCIKEIEGGFAENS
jgi:hypothetical protein